MDDSEKLQALELMKLLNGDLIAVLAERDAAIARAEAAEKRVAELEAAQEWRPVTEDEPAYDVDILFWQPTMRNAECIRRERHPDYGDVWRDDMGVYFKMQSLEESHWRPLPPPPQGE